jgi:CRP-like cAMP-binding protein
VLRSHDGEMISLATLGPGEYFAETALLKHISGPFCYRRVRRRRISPAE